MDVHLGGLPLVGEDLCADHGEVTVGADFAEEAVAKIHFVQEMAVEAAETRVIRMDEKNTARGMDNSILIGLFLIGGIGFEGDADAAILHAVHGEQDGFWKRGQEIARTGFVVFAALVVAGDFFGMTDDIQDAVIFRFGLRGRERVAVDGDEAVHAALGNFDHKLFPKMAVGAQRALATAIKKVLLHLRCIDFCLSHALDEIER